MRDRPHRGRDLSIRACSVLALLSVSFPAIAQVPEEPSIVGGVLRTGAKTFEPTIGADPAGNLYFAEAASPGGVAIGYRAGMYRSTDGGKTWSDISPKLAGHNIPPETNDPYIYVDPATGRAFNFHMSPILTCSILSFTDNGGQSWTTNPAGCFPTVVWDHQTMVAAKPRTVTTTGYPNVLHECVNAVYAAMCSRSLDGGMTWQPPTVAYPLTSCGGLHGHLAAAPDGTLYLPTANCSSAAVFVSRDDGATWTKRVVSDMSIQTPADPTVRVDSEGNVYYAFVDRAGNLFLSVSRDLGVTWTEAVRVAPGITATMPAIAVGDPGRIAIAYPGTEDLPNGFDGPLPPPSQEAWYPYFTVSFDALSASPSFASFSASGEDPIERGHACTSAGDCRYQVDFIDAIIGPNGVPYASFSDGCVTSCITNPGSANNVSGTGQGIVATVVSSPMPWCEARCAGYGPAPS